MKELVIRNRPICTPQRIAIGIVREMLFRGDGRADSVYKADNKKILIVFFSWTGTTKRVASALADRLAAKNDVAVGVIQPVRSRRYLEWLVLSAIPASRVKIKPVDSDFSKYSIVFLGFPKWSLSCPPINEYLKSVSNAEGKRIFPFMTYGGFDQTRYMKVMVSILRKKKMVVVGAHGLPRESIRKNTYSQALDDIIRTSESTILA